MCQLYDQNSKTINYTKSEKKCKFYFGCSLGDQNKQWAPHQICTSCPSGLQNWLNKRTSAMPFAVPMIWKESKDHFQDCYFCLVNAKGFSSKYRKEIIYPNIDSALKPVPHHQRRQQGGKGGHLPPLEIKISSLFYVQICNRLWSFFALVQSAGAAVASVGGGPPRVSLFWGNTV